MNEAFSYRDIFGLYFLMVKMCHTKKCQPVVSLHSPQWTIKASSAIVISVTDIEMLRRSR